MTLARRTLLKLVGAAPAVPLASARLPALLAEAAPLAAMGALVAAPQGTVGEPAPYQRKIPGFIGDAIQAALGDADADSSCHINAIHCVEPDIAYMKSWSASYRYQQQFARNRAERSLLDRARKMLWG